MRRRRKVYGIGEKIKGSLKSVSITCSECSNKHEYIIAAIEKTVACKTCRASIKVPGPDNSDPPVEN